MWLDRGIIEYPVALHRDTVWHAQAGLGKRYLKSIFSLKLPSLPAEGRRKVLYLRYILKVSSQP